jgi:SulP family sulfate permease
VALILTELGPKLRQPLDLAGVTSRVATYETVDAALTAIESATLAEDGGAEAVAPDTSAIARLIARAEAGGAPAFPPEEVPAGTEVLRQGEASDALILLERGRLSARVAGPEGGSMAVASFLPETVVGEIGLYANSARTATVAADIDSTIRRITLRDIDAVSERDPALARDFHAAIAALLARRLARTTELLREMSR